MMDKVDDDISMSSSDEDDYSAEVLKIDEYRQNIKKNPEDYDSHYSLIKALKYSCDNDGARAAREDMNRCYPLSPEMWLEWVEDERESGDDKATVDQLFKRAIEDYNSVDIWCKYCLFVLGYLTEKEEVRTIFEEAIRKVGTQFNKGYLIWTMWMIYEKQVLMEGLEGKNAEEQRDRVLKLFLRQLSIPLEGNSSAFDEFLEWNNDWHYPDEEIRSKYAESLKIADTFRTYEEAILSADVDYASKKISAEQKSKEEGWLNYVSFGEKNMTKVDVVSLYERAVTEICLSQQIWSQYLRYLTKNFDSDEERIITACKRAVRNNKTSLDLRLFLARCMERFSCDADEIRATFNSAFRATLSDVSPFLPMWLAYLDFERRQIASADTHDLTIIRGLFERLVAVDNYLDYDPACVLIKYWALIETRYGGDVERGREIWAMVRKSLGNHCTALWLENLDFERRYGNFESAKRLMSNAVNCFTDYPEYLFEKVLRWVAEDGNIESYLLFVKKTEAQQLKINERRLKEAETKKAEDTDRKLKRKSDENKGKSPQAKKPKSAYKVAEEAKFDVKASRLHEKVEHVVYSEERTVFVSNLNFKVTDKELREMFGKCGDIEDVRIIKRVDGQSKGFAYVQFMDKSDVEEALKLEHEMLMERPMFVNRNDATKRHTFSYPVGETEKNKLFLKNLPKTTTKHALEEIYRKYGTVKDVRLVTMRNGTPKGIAYVEFLDENMASKALVGTDGMMIGENVVEVLLSNTPQKGAIGEESGQVAGKCVESRPSSFLVPRAVAKPIATQKKLIHKSSIATDNTEITETKKSNEEFRKFLG